MELILQSSDTVNSLKAAFHEQYSNLRLQFFKHEHNVGEGSPRKELIPGETLLTELSERAHDTRISCDSGISIGEFEQLIHDALGLNVQVFRRSGSLWLQTLNSDGWSLEEANERANELYEDEEFVGLNDA